MSVDTQTSPVTPGLTMIVDGKVEEPRLSWAVNVLPPSVER